MVKQILLTADWATAVKCNVPAEYNIVLQLFTLIFNFSWTVTLKALQIYEKSFLFDSWDMMENCQASTFC